MRSHVTFIHKKLQQENVVEARTQDRIFKYIVSIAIGFYNFPSKWASRLVLPEVLQSAWVKNE